MPVQNPLRADALQFADRHEAVARHHLHRVGFRQEGADGAAALNHVRPEQGERVAVAGAQQAVDGARIGPIAGQLEESSFINRDAISASPRVGMPSQAGRLAAS